MPALDGGHVDRSWSGRLSRGYALARVSFELIRAQPGLLGVPIAAALSIGVAFLIAAFLAVRAGGFGAFVVAVLALVVIGSISAIAQATIIYRVSAYLQGETIDNARAFQAVKPRMATLAGWGTLSLTVVLALKSLERGRGLGGLLSRIVAAVLTVAWAAMTFFVIPVILFEGLGVRDAMTRSRQLVRDKWGEGVVGFSIISALLNLIGLAAFLLAALLIAAHVALLGILVLIVAVIGCNLLAAVANPVFVVVLYRYATAGQLALGFSSAELDATFRRRRRRFAA